MEPTLYTELLEIGEQLRSLQTRRRHELSADQALKLVAAKNNIFDLQRQLEKDGGLTA